MQVIYKKNTDEKCKVKKEGVMYCLAVITTAALCGIDARIVSVETDVGSGLPTFDMSGYLGTEVKEARDRVRIAIKNTGVELPPQL